MRGKGWKRTRSVCWPRKIEGRWLRALSRSALIPLKIAKASVIILAGTLGQSAAPDQALMSSASHGTDSLSLRL
jgi:hypothetical protein